MKFTRNPSGLILMGVVLVLVLAGCPNYGYKYNQGRFPNQPVNFAEINTAYDDFNATSPIFGEGFPLVFSSNRHSEGANFDLVYKFINIIFSRITGELTVSEGVTDAFNDRFRNCINLESALDIVNTGSDELGPYALFMEQGSDEQGYFGRYSAFLLMYSTGISGNQDIWFTHNLDSIVYEEPKPVQFLNSGSDDCYPCLNGDRSALYFCSDRGGDFDIYRSVLGREQELDEFLASEGKIPVVLDTLFSSSGNDKCPYIAYSYILSGENEVLNNLLVFASDREGGYGGYDLYYSRFNEGTWSEPANFGPVINTEYNEYRPIVMPREDFTNDFMLFSSDRPGGKGGYDLYYVGIANVGSAFY